MGITDLDEVIPIVRHIRELASNYKMAARSGKEKDIVKVREDERKKRKDEYDQRSLSEVKHEKHAHSASSDSSAPIFIEDL